MGGPKVSRRRAMQHVTAAAFAGSALGMGARRARAAGPVQMISHRYPALEYYAEKMRTAVPGVEVNTQLMPFDKANELATIALSSQADTFDIVYASDSTVLKYAKNGWLRPLDDLWEKYKDKYNFGDYQDSVLNSYRYDGKLYVLPHTVNVMLFFYRKDLLDAAGKQPPKTIDEYLALAKADEQPAPGRHDQLPEAGRRQHQRDELVHQRPGRRLVRQGLESRLQRREGCGRDREAEGDDELRPAGLHLRRQRRVHAGASAGSGRDGPAVGDAGAAPWTTRRSRAWSARSTGRPHPAAMHACRATAMRSRPSASRTRSCCSRSSPPPPTRRTCGGPRR